MNFMMIYPMPIGVRMRTDFIVAANTVRITAPFEICIRTTMATITTRPIVAITALIGAITRYGRAIARTGVGDQRASNPTL